MVAVCIYFRKENNISIWLRRGSFISIINYTTESKPVNNEIS